MDLKDTFKPVYFLLIIFFFLLLVLLYFNSVLAGGVLPDTGQTKCYNNSSGEIPCPAEGEPCYGQDGNYQRIQPAYQVSGDGLVVTDLNTGLMWQQADDGVPRNWAPAVSYCEGLSLGGHSDWWLPAMHNLDFIIDYGRYSPSINPAFTCRNNLYWSGSASAQYPDWAGSVNFRNGTAGSYAKSRSHYVRCVRAGP
jgi:hypothetical protein